MLTNKLQGLQPGLSKLGIHCQSFKLLCGKASENLAAADKQHTNIFQSTVTATGTDIVAVLGLRLLRLCHQYWQAKTKLTALSQFTGNKNIAAHQFNNLVANS